MPQATQDVQQLNQAIQAAMRSVRSGGAQHGGFAAQPGGGFTRTAGDTGWEQQLGDQLRERIRDAMRHLQSSTCHAVCRDLRLLRNFHESRQGRSLLCNLRQRTDDLAELLFREGAERLGSHVTARP